MRNLLSTFKPKAQSANRDALAAAITARREAAARASARSAELSATLARLSDDIAAPDAIRDAIRQLDEAEQSAMLLWARDQGAPRPEINVERRDELERQFRQARAAAAAAEAAKTRLEAESKTEAQRDEAQSPAIFTAIGNASPAIFIETASTLADAIVDELSAHIVRRDMLVRIAEGFGRALADAEGEERNRQADAFTEKIKRDGAEFKSWGEYVPEQRTAPIVHDRPLDHRLLAARENFAATQAQLKRVDAAFSAPAPDEIKAKNAAALAEFERDLREDAYVSLEV
jgi:hypothetical protein